MKNAWTQSFGGTEMKLFGVSPGKSVVLLNVSVLTRACLKSVEYAQVSVT